MTARVPHPSDSSNGPGTHVLVLSSGHGGKTTAALALAEYLPRLDTRLRVALVDTALFCGQVARNLGLDHYARTLPELLMAAGPQLAPDMLANFLTMCPWGFTMLAAPSSSTYLANSLIEPGIVTTLYDMLLRNLDFDIVISDTPPDARRTSFAPTFFGADRRNRTVVLLLYGPRAYDQAHFTHDIDYLHARGFLDRTWLVYVQTRPFRSSRDQPLLDRLEETAAKAGLRGVAGRIPFEDLVEDAYDRRLPFWSPELTGGNGSPLQVSMEALAREVLEICRHSSQDRD